MDLLHSSSFLLLMLPSLFNSFCLSHQEVNTYIIHASKDMKPSSFATHHEWYTQTLYSIKGISIPSEASVGPPVDPGILYVYRNVFHGFATTMTGTEASMLLSVPGFRSIMLDRTLELHTTRTPEFLGLDELGRPSDLWTSSRFGEDVIVGIFDTGIWPERPSFDDTGMGPVPARWKGTCESGVAFDSSSCNRKVIGVRAFSKGYEKIGGPINASIEFKSGRDENGHGTHTSSTVGGRVVANASLFGYAMGQASGMAPLARLAIYKVCWARGCSNSDILAAFDVAVTDGVDIISLSLGGLVVPHYEDPIAIGAFGAMEHDIVTCASAGNDGPFPSLISNLAPWVLTVAASTLDRTFPAPVTLGNDVIYNGVSLFSGSDIANHLSLPLVYGKEAAIDVKNNVDASCCLPDALNSSLIAGKIVLCDRGLSSNLDKALVVKEAGGAAMIIANTLAIDDELVAESFTVPGTLVGFEAGRAIKAYIRSTPNPMARIAFQGTILNVKPSPIMASFSSRGPNPIVLEILKPDLTAPGVNILAAWTGKIGPSGEPSDTRVVDFNIISGTSMSCPHVSGLTALLKGVYPHWSPSALKSALMTTSTLLDNKGGYLLDSATGSISTPFVHGAGHVVPQAAMDPGLVYDISVQNYVDYLCGLNYSASQLAIFAKGQYNCSDTKVSEPSDLNYPSFSIPFMQESLNSTFSATYSRTVRNVGTGASTYKVEVVEPKGVRVTIAPSILQFKESNEKLTYKVTFEATPVESNATNIASFGNLAWKDGTHHVVQSPIAFTWVVAV